MSLDPVLTRPSCSCPSDEDYHVDRDIEPEKFYALCDKNRRIHEEMIQQTYDDLICNGVPEKYIFVIHANRNINGEPEKGDVFPYSDKSRLEQVLSSIRNSAKLCCSPDVFITLCTDVRDIDFMKLYLCHYYFEEKWFLDMVAEIH